MLSFMNRRNGSRPKVLLSLLAIFVALVTVACGGSSNQKGTVTLSATASGSPGTPTGMLHAQGTHLVDATGKQVILRGAQIESPFNYIKTWNSGKRPTTTLNSTTFTVMVHQWDMNVIRIPTSNWIYAKYPTDYMNQLNQVVQQANAAGLYVVLDLHDDAKAGSPYGSNATLPKTEDVTYWKAIASNFKSNPMVFYDLYNEPQEPNWQTWENGGGNTGGATIVGMPDLVNAIRSVGAQQLIVVEPGSAGHDPGGNAESSGWTNFPPGDAIKDSNIAYSLHVYGNIGYSAQQQDAKWGPILNHYPLFYGEWAFLPNAAGAGGGAKCNAVPHAEAAQVVTNFLNYMASRGASWVAWAFMPHYLVTDYKSYSPTTLNTAWTCGDQSTTNVGMGEIIKSYLTSHPAANLRSKLMGIS